jgi:hypothetical protein
MILATANAAEIYTRPHFNIFLLPDEDQVNLVYHLLSLTIVDVENPDVQI